MRLGVLRRRDSRMDGAVKLLERGSESVPVDPVSLCAAIGVTLRVSRAKLQAKGREILGAWDPLLRRIELFGVTADADDAQLCRTFAHELWHARTECVCHGGEPDAVRFADAWVQAQRPERVARMAAALRRMAEAGYGSGAAG